MVIDEFLPEYDFNETHSIAIDASAANVYAALNKVDFADSFIVRWLLRLRGMSGENVTMSKLRNFSFETLGEIANREIVIGLAGRFWTPWGDLQKIDANTFREFDKKGYAKAAWNFSLESLGDATSLTTETRIKCLDSDSRSSFGFYWMFIRPFSGLIRIEMLKTIKQRAESGVLAI